MKSVQSKYLLMSKKCAKQHRVDDVMSLPRIQKAVSERLSSIGSLCGPSAYDRITSPDAPANARMIPTMGKPCYFYVHVRKFCEVRLSDVIIRNTPMHRCTDGVNPGHFSAVPLIRITLQFPKNFGDAFNVRNNNH